MEIHSTEGSIKSVKREIKDIALAVVKQNNPTVKKVNEDKIAELEEDQERLEEELEVLKKQVSHPGHDILSLQQFLNLSKNAAVIIKSANPIVKDAICRLIFLNLTVDEQKVLSYQLKPPFDEMLKSRQQRTSAGERT